MAAERTFRAMGSDAHLIVVGGAVGLIGNAHRRIDELERKWSRFIDDSEVSELNRHAGDPLHVSGDTVLLVRRAVEAWRLSGGAFDPTLLQELIRAGYDRSFELIGEASQPRGWAAIGPGPDEIVVGDTTVMIPKGSGFDPGGIGKGLAADLVCEETMNRGADGVCVNLGGDIRVAGRGPEGGPDSTWTVAVEHPEQHEPLALVGLADGAVATSTTLRRTWRVDGARRHHIIDPQTGEPSDTDVTLATVIAGQAWMAEVLAKAVILAGSAHPFDILGGTGAQALAVSRDGRVMASDKFHAYLGTSTLPPSIVRA